MKYSSIILLVCLLFGACKTKVDKASLYNTEASFTKDDSLPFNPLEWPVITTVMNTKKHTMSTLYGNEIALAHARDSANQYYPPGSVLCLVTWAQQEDKHWFGANIPKKIQSIEVATFDSANGERYTNYQGTPLREYLTVKMRDLPLISDIHKTTLASERMAYIIGQRMLVVP